MKKTLLAIAVAAISMSGFAAAPQALEGARNSMRESVNHMMEYKLRSDMGLLNQNVRTLAPVYNWEGTDTITYFVGAQSFMNGWQFDPNGGESKNYEMGVLRDGNRVVFTNLFDSYDPTSWSANHDFPVEGVYDEAAGTITFDCPQPAVDVYGSYIADLAAFTGFDQYGQVTDEYKLDKLVFNVTPDFKTITATSYFGAQYAWGWAERYKTFTATKEDPNDPANIIKIGEDLAFGQTYAGMTIEKTFALLNIGGQPGEYVITVESEDGEFYAEKISGEVEPYSKAEITFAFAPKEAGTFEGLATIEVEDGEPILVYMTGEGLATPDFSPIVKGGDFTFETVVDWPAKIATVDHDGQEITVAQMGTEGIYGMSSLKAKFSVPEGKMGVLTFKGFYQNPSVSSWLGAAYILYDEDNIYDYIFQESGNFPQEACTREFPEGDHYLMVAVQDANSHLKDLYGCIWDLNLEIVDPSNNPPVMLTPEVFLGFGIAGGRYETEKMGTLEIQNKSTKMMKIESISCDNDEFDYSIPSMEVGLLEKILIPIEMVAETPGYKVANYTIVTNLGTLTAKVEAKTCEYPDYSELVEEGLEMCTFEVNRDYPFVMEDGIAYNITSEVPDPESTYSSFTFTVDVPEGYIANLQFEGHSWGTPEDMYTQTSYWDFGGLQIAFAEAMNGTNGFTACFYNNDVAVSENYWAEIGEPMFTELCTMPEGKNEVTFFYQQGGDKKWYGEDRLEIHSIRIVLKSTTGIENLGSEEVASKEYFTLTGVRVANPDKGFYIERTRYNDGSVSARKVMMGR